MSEKAPTTPESEVIERRELSSIVVADTVPSRGLVMVHANKEEAVELIRRLILSHYHQRPDQVASWLEQLDGMVRQLSSELNDYGVILFDDILSDDPLRTGWLVDASDHAGGARIVFKRTGNIRDYPSRVGRDLGDKLQEDILNAMAAQE